MKLQFTYILFLLILIQGCSSSSKVDRGYIIPSLDEPTQTSFHTVKNLIIVEAEVNGTKGLFLFDNGFTLSAVNHDFARRANIQSKTTSGARDANNKKTSLGESTIDTTIIGGHQFIKTGFYIIDSKKFLPCDSLDGVIGASIINKANWEIDFENNVMRISSQPFINEGFRMKVFFTSNNSSFTTLKIKDKISKFKIDLGSSKNIKLRQKEFYDLFQHAQAEERIGVTSFSAFGMGNEDQSYKLTDPVDLVHEGKQLPLKGLAELLNNMKYAGYIGVGYLNDYKMTINSSQQEYILAPIKDEVVNDAKSWGISIYLVKGEWKIIQLNTHESSLSGIGLMDVVSAIDSISMSHFNGYCEYETYVKKKLKSKESLSITTNGKTYVLPYKKQQTVVLK